MNCGELVKRLRWWEKLLVNPLVAVLIRKPWYVHDSSMTVLGRFSFGGVSRECDSVVRFDEQVCSDEFYERTQDADDDEVILDVWKTDELGLTFPGGAGGS